MEHLAPTGPVYQAGTLSGNPLAMAAGIATLDLLQEKSYTDLEKMTETLCNGYRDLFAAKGHPRPDQPRRLHVHPLLHRGRGDRLRVCLRSDTERFARFFQGMLAEGIYLAPAQFEAGFVSFAHTDEEIARTLEACGKVLEAGGF